MVSIDVCGRYRTYSFAGGTATHGYAGYLRLHEKLYVTLLCVRCAQQLHHASVQPWGTMLTERRRRYIGMPAHALMCFVLCTLPSPDGYPTVRRGRASRLHRPVRPCVRNRRQQDVLQQLLRSRCRGHQVHQRQGTRSGCELHPPPCGVRVLCGYPSQWPWVGASLPRPQSILGTLGTAGHIRHGGRIAVCYPSSSALHALPFAHACRTVVSAC